MKTIAYIDRNDSNRTLQAFKIKNNHLISLFCQKKNERIKEAFKNLIDLGNINVYYIRGGKTRFLFSRGF